MTYIAPPPPPKADATGIQEETRSGRPVPKSKDSGANDEVKIRLYLDDKPKRSATADDDDDDNLGVDPKKYQTSEEKYGFAHQLLRDRRGLYGYLWIHSSW
jgi:hypothetical protein